LARYVSRRAVLAAAACTAAGLALRAEDEVRSPIRETFEKYEAGFVLPETYASDRLRAKGATIEVSQDVAAAGTKSLKVVSAAGLEQPWWPHICWTLRGKRAIARGEVTIGFDICNSAAAPASFSLETRDWSKDPFVAGPAFLFRPDGTVDLPGAPGVAKLPLGQWSHLEVRFALTEATGRQGTVRIVLPDKTLRQQEIDLDDRFRAFTWLGLVNGSKDRAVYDVDNLQVTVKRPKETGTMPTPFANYILRGNLMRSYAAFARGGPVRVAFMGGSVTTQVWREEVMDYLRERFPDAAFDFVMAGIGGTDANLGAFRLPTHVFGRGPVDLFFLEFAVNGGGLDAMEGIVRQSLRLCPGLDIVMMYFANTGYLEDVKAGRVPQLVQTHEKVAEHYGIPVVCLYKEVGERIGAGKLTWEQFSRDSVHPTDAGCALYAECITSFLDQAWADPKPKPTARPAALPEKLDPRCFGNGRFIGVEQAKVAKGFAPVRGWTTEKTCNFSPPVDVLEATEPDSELTLDFEGTAVGIYTIVGFDAGILEYAIDGGPVQTRDQFDTYCDKFHRPQHTLFAMDLAPGKHTLRLRLSAEHNPKGTGAAVRILQFMAN
jgi:lysophospholipase L1-like esterase